MPPKEKFDLILKKPVSILNRSINLDFKSFFTALANLGLSGVTFDTKGASKSSIDLLKSLSLKEDPEQVAWLLVSRSIMNALEILVTDYQDLFTSELDQKAIKDLAERVDHTMSNIEVGLDTHFFKNPKKLTLLNEVKPALDFWLCELGMDTYQSNEFFERLKNQFVIALHDEWKVHPSAYKSILENLETPFAKATLNERQRARYNLWLQEQANQRVFSEAFGLRRIYIKLRAYYEDKMENKESEYKAFDLHKEVENWVKKFDSENTLKVICGGPGSGKSSFSKILAADLSETSTIPILFIPLHHFNVSDDLIDGVEKFISRDPYLSKNPMDIKEGEDRLLVIFDGLDELSMQGGTSNDIAQNFIDEVIRTLARQNGNGKNWQALVTGRNISIQAIEDRLRKVGQIVHVLPYVLDEEEIEKYKANTKLLKQDQREEWWRKFGEAKGKDFRSLPEELKAENLIPITREPLLNYLIALSYERQEIEFNEDTSLNEIYYDLLKAVYERQYESEGQSITKHINFENFLTVLEEVALAVWHSNGRTASEAYILQRCNENGLTQHLESFSEGAKKGVTRLLTAFYFRQFGTESTGEKTFEFTHKSFGEYLAARRIVGAAKTVFEEISRHKKSARSGWNQQQAVLEWIKICGPTNIDHYVAKFLYDEVRNEEIRNLVEWQAVFIEFFATAIKEKLPMELSGIKSFAVMVEQYQNASNALLLMHSAIAKCTNKISDTLLGGDIQFSDFYHLNRGTSNLIHHLNLTESTFFSNNLNFTSISHSNFYKSMVMTTFFQNSYLLNTNFQNSHFYEANFKNANIKDSNFSGSVLINSNFTEVVLTNVNMQSIECTNTIFCHGDMAKTDLEAATFTDCDLTSANLESTNLKDADFTGCNLTSTNLENANLENANLTNANLTNANLTNANLTNAKLKGAILSGTNLKGAILNGADFDKKISKSDS